MAVPANRIRTCNAAPIQAERACVLYWMVAFRRTQWNFALDRAIEHARALGKPLLVFESLRAGYRWASDRHHAFILQGTSDNRAACAAAGVTFVAHAERRAGDSAGLLDALARRACVVVTDDYPAFFLPRMIAAAAASLDVRLEAVDSNGLMPLAATDRAFPTAFAFRAFLHRELRPHLEHFPSSDPLDAAADLSGADVDVEVARRWQLDVTPSTVDGRGRGAGTHASAAATGGSLPATTEALRDFAIDHTVAPVAARGGAVTASRALDAFLSTRLDAYKEARGVPDEDGASGLSPYLHFGHVSIHDVFSRLMTREGWTTRRLSAKGGGKREGWWNVSAAAESFLDEAITWRELGYVTCHHRPVDYDKYESLPEWAQRTLGAHAGDRREFVYMLDEFARAETHDPLWNAAQRQLVREGIIHNYLRMLWGKKILEWTASPREALDVMLELNNRYALDGRDPNSYSGIFWVLGRYDRPWAPERPVFGTIRYMSSTNTAKKTQVKRYLQKYAAGASPTLF